MGWFNPARLYDIFAEVLSVLNIFALGLCAFFTMKGVYFPSTSDSGSNGNIIYDFWWGAVSSHLLPSPVLILKAACLKGCALVHQLDVN